MSKILKSRKHLPPCTKAEEGWEKFHFDGVRGFLPDKVNRAYEAHLWKCRRCRLIHNSLEDFALEVMGVIIGDSDSPPPVEKVNDYEISIAGFKVLLQLAGPNESLPEDSLFLLKSLIEDENVWKFVGILYLSIK